LIDVELGRICTEAVAAELRYVPIFSWRDIAGVGAEIKTEYLWFTSIDGSRYINLLGGHRSFSLLSYFFSSNNFLT
jgi:hypothetical protein